jgi:hypothetical protein
MTRVLRSYANQTAASDDLKQYLEPNQYGALSGALNDVYSGRGSNSGNHTVDDFDGPQHILHASSGVAGTNKTVTLFYFMVGTVMKLIALAQHKTTTTYGISSDLGQAEEPFRRGKTVGPNGS